MGHLRAEDAWGNLGATVWLAAGNAATLASTC